MFVNAGDRAGRHRSAMYLLASTVTTGTAASVTFGNIPTQYRDLQLRVNGRGTTAATSINFGLQFNGDTGANYTWQSAYLFSTNTVVAGTSTGQTSVVLGELSAASAPANFATGAIIDIPNYRGTTFYKVGHARACMVRSNAVGGFFSISFVGAWLNQSAINSLKFFPTSGSIVDGSVFSLYGIS